jgi:hypothetical protein
MVMENTARTPAERGTVNRPSRLPWEAPQLTKLPALTELTLATGGPIGGGGGGGGTVF